MQHTNPIPNAGRAPERAFTIIEMLVVLGIVGIIVAILLPAIAGVRRSAKNTRTTTTVTQLIQASQKFLNDNRRLPGYFTAEEMGDVQNGRRGFPQMANILLDLSGGWIKSGDDDRGLDSLEDVGPTTSTTVTVIPDRIGATEGTGAAKSLYFTPDKNALKTQTDPGAMAAGWAVHKEVPQLVDAFGTPLLAWAESDAIGTTEFASENSGVRAKFYWVSNTAYLGNAATSVGRERVDQATNSLLAAGRTNRFDTMEALLGHPTYPDNSSPPRPTTSRGGIVFHSAGPNALFLGDSEQAAKIAGPGNPIRYSGTEDPIRRSDDVISALGK